MDSPFQGNETLIPMWLVLDSVILSFRGDDWLVWGKIQVLFVNGYEISVRQEESVQGIYCTT